MPTAVISIGTATWRTRPQSTSGVAGANPLGRGGPDLAVAREAMPARDADARRAGACRAAFGREAGLAGARCRPRPPASGPSKSATPRVYLAK